MNYKFKVLTMKEQEEWKLLINGIEENDVYFLPEYAEVYEQSYPPEINNEFCGKALLFFYGNKEEYIIEPFIKRRINDIQVFRDIKEEYFDIISPYGYSGPLLRFKEENSRHELIEGYLKRSHDYCKNNNIVSEFTRFHPLLKNHLFFEKMIKVKPINKTVFIDLTKDPETIFRDMDKKTRNLIKKAEKNKVEVHESKSELDLRVFAELYLKTMKKKSAQAKYFFPYKYFKYTCELLKENTVLFVAKYRNSIIAASLFMHHNHKIHYHFSGLDRNFASLAPNNLILYTAIKWGKLNSFKSIHLGGGNSKDENDPLYHFKKGFSKETAIFHCSCRIHNHKIYKRLTSLRIKEKGSINLSFFPAYRWQN